jgi:putative transposase
MKFEKGNIYHIYNQGNNRQKLFFNKDNYLFFLKKMHTYILPYASIFAWCLMPNHFHIMALINETEIPVDSHTIKKQNKTRTINDSIAILLRSYTRAINKQQNTSGSLFRQKTKAICINCHQGVTPSFYTKNGCTAINIKDTKKQYPQVCFDYIHQNPVKSNLVKIATDWEFSSAKDYANLRNGKLINKTVALEYVTYSSDDLESSDE